MSACTSRKSSRLASASSWQLLLVMLVLVGAAAVPAAQARPQPDPLQTAALLAAAPAPGRRLAAPPCAPAIPPATKPSAAAAAGIDGQAGKATHEDTGPPPTEASCYASDYTTLHNYTHRSDCGAEHKDLLLCCGGGNIRTLVRGPDDDPLVMDVSDVLSWHVHGNYSCRHRILVNVTANPALPALTVTGHIGMNEIILTDLTFVVVGDFAAAGYSSSCLTNPGACPAIIDILNVEQVTLENVTVQGVGGQQLPVTGIQIKTVSGGDTKIALDGVTVTNCVDGIRILGGGELRATNVRSLRNYHNGITYECGFVQRSSILVQGGRTALSSNGAYGLWVNCDGDLSPPIDINITGGTFSKNNVTGIYLLGHSHTTLGTGVKVIGNGAGPNLPVCGGGLYTHFSYGTPGLELDGCVFESNMAQNGGAVCVEGPHSDDSIIKVTGPVILHEGSRFEKNAAVGGCGGIITTVANISRIRISMDIRNSASLWSSTSNTAKYAPIWCMMQDLEDKGDFMDIRLT